MTMLNIPNTLSLLRILLIPVFVYLLNYDSSYGLHMATAVLAVSYLTDILDGYIARSANMVTEMGKILDPLADKLTQLVAVITLVIKHYIPLIILIVILIKEVTQICGGLYIKFKLKTQMPQANILGKIATGMFYISILLLLLSVPYAIYLLYLTAVLLIAAFANYIILFVKFKKQSCNNLN
ncbi:MAG: CDP-diacylglycerol--glycerol-3-phosphate 3-phosphatidyltransferase [Eubacteriaceae bacterium]|nr:CDP-diacylglycerol--glycerol-3-phosphate 3-phosphatidyltransferase [Eubacteriaceae bacterium]